MAITRLPAESLPGAKFRNTQRGSQTVAFGSTENSTWAPGRAREGALGADLERSGHWRFWSLWGDFDLCVFPLALNPLSLP
eukprot:COSAG02_NODE_396_length_23126_cov_282.150258_7_plen_81_part_00